MIKCLYYYTNLLENIVLIFCFVYCEIQKNIIGQFYTVIKLVINALQYYILCLIR